MNSIKGIIFIFSTICLFLPLSVMAYGDGYYDCERDAIYERNDKGHPTMGLRLRKRACMTDSEVLKVLPEGQEINIIAETDGWYKVRDSVGAIGWVGARLVKVTEKGSVNKRLGSEHFYLNVGKEISQTDREAMFKRTRGYILLAVEAKGEAWYVDPVSQKRYYLKNGLVAYDMLREFGLGISNRDLEKLESGDNNLVERLKGRIVLQVEKNGEAFYIHPKDGSVHYLKNGDEAYRIMRELGLGITNADLGVIEFFE